MEDKPIANYDRLGLLDEDLDDMDSSELVAGKVIALGKFLEKVLNQPLLRVTIKGQREIEIAKSGRGYSAKFTAKKTELPGADCPVYAFEMSNSHDHFIATRGEMSSKILDHVEQPDVYTCQSAAIARVIGSTDVMDIRHSLTQGGREAGDPWNMGRYLEKYCQYYKFSPTASLNDARKALEEGCHLITHGFFTGSGHVIGLSRVDVDPKTLSYRFNAEDPWYEFDFPSWSYTRNSGDDVSYSSYGIYAACVASSGVSHAAEIYRRGELNSAMKNMWLHVVKN